MPQPDDPTIVTNPNDSDSSGDGFDDPPDLAAQRGESVHDATTLKIDFTVPPAANCLALSYRFLSEEFPEFVGSRFNDAFVAELDKTTWTTDANQEIVVPDDFATKAGGKPVSVNGVGPTAVSVAARFSFKSVMISIACEIFPVSWLASKVSGTMCTVLASSVRTMACRTLIIWAMLAIRTRSAWAWKMCRLRAARAASRSEFCW